MADDLDALVQEYTELRPKVEKKGRSDEDLARYRELNDAIAKLVTERKANRAAGRVAEGDGVATPEAVTGSTKVKGE